MYIIALEREGAAAHGGKRRKRNFPSICIIIVNAGDVRSDEDDVAFEFYSSNRAKTLWVAVLNVALLFFLLPCILYSMSSDVIRLHKRKKNGEKEEVFFFRESLSSLTCITFHVLLCRVKSSLLFKMSPRSRRVKEKKGLPVFVAGPPLCRIWSKKEKSSFFFL